MEPFPFLKYFDADRGRGLQTTADYVANSRNSLFKFFLAWENFAARSCKISPFVKSTPNTLFRLGL